MGSSDAERGAANANRRLRSPALCRDLPRHLREELMEDDRSPLMQRNAVIALGDIGTGEAMDILRHYKGIGTGKLDEYIAWAVDLAAKRTGRDSKPEAGDA